MADIVCIFLLFGNSLSDNSNLCYGSSSTLSNRGTHMAVGVVISFCGAKSRAFRDDRPRTRSEDRPGHPRRHKPGHAGLADAPSASLRAAQRKSRGGENLLLHKALKTHETGKSIGSDRQRGASPRGSLTWPEGSAHVWPA